MTANSASFDKWDDGSASGELTAVLDKLGEIARAASKGSFVFRGEPKVLPGDFVKPLPTVQDVARIFWC